MPQAREVDCDARRVPVVAQRRVAFRVVTCPPPRAAAKRHHHFDFLEFLGELVAVSGSCADGAVFFAKFGAEEGHWVAP